jgi:hypothetical protein
MNVMTTSLTVGADGSISSAEPIPAGEYTATIERRDAAKRPLTTQPVNLDWLPVRDLGPWPEGLSLRREDMYGDDGR